MSWQQMSELTAKGKHHHPVRWETTVCGKGEGRKIRDEIWEKGELYIEDII